MPFTAPALTSHGSGSVRLAVPAPAPAGLSLWVEDATGAAAGVTVQPSSGTATLFLRSAAGQVTELASTTTAGDQQGDDDRHARRGQGAATLHWLSWEAGPAAPGAVHGGRLAYGRGTEAGHPAAVVLAASLRPGAPPLARTPGRLPALTVGVDGPPAIALGSTYAARQAGRAGGRGGASVLALSPHPALDAPLSPLAAPPGWATSLAAMADPAAPVPAALLPNRTVRAVVEALAAPGVALPPALAAAISHSLASPSGLLARTLAAKARAGGLPYLRVGVAPRAGALAPGEPFVLEIWPAGAASPIHGHGGCCGGFVVLHGACVLRTFNSLDGGGAPARPGRPPLFEGVCGPGTVGWFDGTHHQVHSIAAAVPLAPGEFCATLQAFRYDADGDDVASPFMEIECGAGSGAVHDVDPASDFQYAEMSAALLAEHAAAAGKSGGGGVEVEVSAAAAAAPPPPAADAVDDEEQGEEEAGPWSDHPHGFVWVI